MKKQDNAVRVELMKLSDALDMRHRKNPKEHDVPSLVASFRRFGFIQPPMIDEATSTMVAGHGRCIALQHMIANKEAPPDGVQVVDGDWMLPVLRGHGFKNEKERDAYVVTDNQHTIKGGWNVDALTEFLSGLKDVGFAGTGFDDVDLNTFGITGNPLEEFADDDGDNDKPDVVIPDRRVSVMFTSEQFDELKDALNGKPTSEEIVRLVKLGKRAGITPSAEAKGTLAGIASRAKKG